MYVSCLLYTSPTTRIFYILFQLAHSPKRQPCVAWLTVFREKSRWKPAQAYCKQAPVSYTHLDVYKRQVVHQVYTKVVYTVVVVAEARERTFDVETFRQRCV